MVDNNEVRVAILGGGVGGLSAAHELGERGFEVTLYERNERFGGRSRSFPGPKNSDGTSLPAEHGFRFFPGFYQHVTETMSRIPYKSGSVKDNLVETPEFMQATNERRWAIQTRPPKTFEELRYSVGTQLGGPHVSRDEKAYFCARLFHLLTSSEQRWNDHFETVSWWEFINAENMSEEYQKILGYGISQVLLAAHPEMASTRAIGQIYLQLLQGINDASMEADRVLNGPTNHVWIDPWTDYLEQIGVNLQLGVSVQAIESDGDVVTGVRIDDGNTTSNIKADYYVAALSIEAMREFLTPELGRAAPSLRGVEELTTEWMNGIMFYLNEDIRITQGHTSYFDSPWALTTVSQRQFWEEYDISDHEDIAGILSVCISDWNRPGVIYDKPARKCSPEQIKDEVLEQLKRHLNDSDEVMLSDDIIETWFLDPAIQYDRQSGEVRNSESLLINTVGSLQYRPEAATKAENLVVATDFVRTNTDLATMEAANEAARRAVNAILNRSGSDADPCTVKDISVPPVLSQLRKIDDLLYQGQIAHPGTITPAVWKFYNNICSLF